VIAKAPIAGVKRYRDRHGKWRNYHRATGKALKAEYGTAAFAAEVAELDGVVAKKPAAPNGTLKGVMDEYKTTPAFADLAMATRSGYERYFEIAKPLHDVPIKSIDSAGLSVIRDKVAMKRGRRTANYMLSVLSVLFGFAIERKYVTQNPAFVVKRAKRDKSKPKANRPWSLDERQVVLAAAPPHLKVPIALAMFTGVRKRDALTLRKDAIRGGRIETSKTGEEIYIRIHPELAAILASVPEHLAPTIAATSRGTPWTESGFNSVWDKFKDKLEADGKVRAGLTIHGLRHTLGGHLADAGCDLDTIRRVLGQKTLTMAQLYSERAKKEAATKDAMERIDLLGSRSRTENGPADGE
jgi:integrase